MSVTSSLDNELDIRLFIYFLTFQSHDTLFHPFFPIISLLIVYIFGFHFSEVRFIV